MSFLSDNDEFHIYGQEFKFEKQLPKKIKVSRNTLLVFEINDAVMATEYSYTFIFHHKFGLDPKQIRKNIGANPVLYRAFENESPYNIYIRPKIKQFCISTLTEVQTLIKFRPREYIVMCQEIITSECKPGDPDITVKYFGDPIV